VEPLAAEPYVLEMDGVVLISDIVGDQESMGIRQGFVDRTQQLLGSLALPCRADRVWIYAQSSRPSAQLVQPVDEIGADCC
jgi:hypothetical protein